MSTQSLKLRGRTIAFITVGALGAIGTVAAFQGDRSSSKQSSASRTATSSPESAAPSDAMVDIGGFKLHLSCSGEGSPTVLLESGNGPTSAGWAWVAPQIAETARVCVYDRAGTGRSEESPNVRDARHIAQELHELLDAGRIGRPLVLVGHSYGGLYARQYAAMYPAEVVGMVLVDSAHPDQWTRHTGAAEQFESIVASMQDRITSPPASPPANTDLPPWASKRMAVDGNTVKHLNTARAEFLATGSTNDQVRHDSRSLGDIPLVVLSATEHGFPPEIQAQMEANHLEMQRELATLSAGGRLRLADGADHNGLLANEKSARATVGSIEAVLEAVRTGAPLTSI